MALDRRGPTRNLWSRRTFLRRGSQLGLIMAAGTALSACQQQVIERIVEIEKEVTTVVQEIRRETVVVSETPRIIERTVEKVVTPSPAPKSKTVVVAQVMHYGWTQFARQKTPTFAEFFPGITLDWHIVAGWRDYPAKVAALQAADALGDLLEAPFGALPVRWAQRQVIRPISDLVAADGFDTSGIFRSAIRACYDRGQLIGLPFLAHGSDSLLLYHKGCFDEAGIPRPRIDWTLDDLAEAAAALSQSVGSLATARPFPYALRYGLPEVGPMLNLFRARLFSQDGRRCLIVCHEGLECLRWADALARRGLVPAPFEIEGGVLGMLSAGRLSMVRHHFRSLVDLTRADEEGSGIGGVLFPRHPSTGEPAALASGMAYHITRHSQVPNEAFQWLKFMSSREMGAQMFLEGYADPGCRPASWKDPRILELYPVCAPLADVIDHATLGQLPWNLRVIECMEAWNRAIDPFLRREIGPEACAARIVEGVNRVLAQPIRLTDEMP